MGAVALAAAACRGDQAPLASEQDTTDVTGVTGGGAIPTGTAAVAPPSTAGPPTADGGPTASSTAPTSAAPTTTAPGAAAAAKSGGPAAFVRRGPTTTGQVALTFHTNGDPALAHRLLDRLAAHRVPVTAFVVGNWLAEHPELGHRLVAEGHELANHTWSHPTMGGLDRATIAEEIAGCVDVLATYLGGPGAWFRPSGMEIASDDVLIEAGRAGYRTVVGYNVDSLDFTDPGIDAVRRNVNDAVGAGDIVSLHFGHADTLGAIDAIIEHLSGQGLRPVTLTTLLGR